MATAITPRPPKFVPALNVPQTIAIATIPGRMVPSEFGPSEVVFSLTDGRPWYVPQCVADQIYAMGFQPREQMEVTATGKKKTEVRIAAVQPRIPQRVPDRDYSPELRQSIENAQCIRNVRSNRDDGPEPVWADTEAPAHRSPNSDGQSTAPQSTKHTGATACMMASMCSAVDAILETQAYATRKGLGLTFSEESVRAIGLSIYIDACRNGGNR